MSGHDIGISASSIVTICSALVYSTPRSSGMIVQFEVAAGSARSSFGCADDCGSIAIRPRLSARRPSCTSLTRCLPSAPSVMRKSCSERRPIASSSSPMSNGAPPISSISATPWSMAVTKPRRSACTNIGVLPASAASKRSLPSIALVACASTSVP